MTLEHLGDHATLRLEGDCTLTSAAEIKELLVAGLSAGKPLNVDMEGAEADDISVLQLMWAAEREAGRAGTGFAVQASEACRDAARAAGFDRFPGHAAEEQE
jgi:hypothetical protein